MVVTQSSSTVRMYSLMRRIFMWMAAALAVTGISAYYVASYPSLQQTFFSTPCFIFLVFAQLALVIALSFFIQKMNYGTAISLLLLYSLLNGLLLSVIFTIYTQASITVTFFIASSMFAAMAVYGAFTKADLTHMGSFVMMGIWGLIIVLVINLFLKSSLVDFVASFAGVILFSLLTAFDIQRIKQLSTELFMRNEAENKIAVIGALQLYLDFINIFLSLLRLTGRSRQ